MNNLNNKSLCAWATTALIMLAQTTSAQTSPNGKLNVSYNNGTSAFEVFYQNSKVMTMPLQQDCDSPVKQKKTKVKYNMITGKRSLCTNEYNETVYWHDNGHQLIVRAYNDGIAWTSSSPNLNRDGYHVSFSTATNSWLMTWADSYEGFFPRNRKVKDGQRYAYPALFEYADGVFALLSESGLKKTEAASSFYGTPENGEFVIKPDLAIVQPQKHREVSTKVEHGGWQTLIVGSLADVVQSTLITDNSEPSTMTDTSWIKPGMASWIYWANNHGSNDYSIICKYVDMAAKLHLPYVLIDAEWDDMHKLASNNSKTIEDAIKYATDRGIKPLIWYNSSVGWVSGAPTPLFRLNTPEDCEREFAWCEKMGIKGVKIDFFSGDNNMNISYMADLLECAAKHHLLVNFHGATTMRGWQRTYPHLITAEAVYGAEWYNNVPTFTKVAASHNATLPFTRNVIGSMDYTPCAFTDSQHPHITTHGHELALTVLFESGIQHLADRPESFLSQAKPVQEFLGSLPTTWDDTRYISGYPGEDAVIARRKGTTWYVAGINGTDNKRSLNLSALRSLGIKKATAQTFTDNVQYLSSNTGEPFVITSQDIKAAESIPQTIDCAPRGGFIMVIRK